MPLDVQRPLASTPDFATQNEFQPGPPTPQYWPGPASGWNTAWAPTDLYLSWIASKMPVQSIQEWAASRPQTLPLSALKDATIGVDASYYLDLRLNRSGQEPLLHALGGFPYSLKSIVEQDIEILQGLDISLVFAFDGLDFRNKEQQSSKNLANRRANEDGWQHYLDGDADLTVKDFTRATYPVNMLHRYLQKLLLDNHVQFMVAPYSAAAQLSYLEKHTEQFIDTVMASDEAFLFGIEKIITNFDADNSNFTWLSKTACQDRLDRPSNDLFRDAQLLLGSTYLPTFPALEKGNPQKQTSIRDALNLLNNAGRSVSRLCEQYRDDVQVQHLQYADRYKKAVMTIRHHVILDASGIVTPMDLEHAPGDVHEFIGQRLPDELYFYISRGLIGPQVPNWLTSGEISLSLPPGCVDTEVYRRLVTNQLNDYRTQCLSLLSTSLHRYYQMRSVSLKIWYDADTKDKTINLKDLKDSRSVTNQMLSWKIYEADIPDSVMQSLDEQPFLSALRSLQDKSFVEKIASKPSTTALRSQKEITSNALWRFLQLRGYINDKHELTSWGLALTTALSALDPTEKFDEYVLVAIEMLRLGFLLRKDMQNVTGAAALGDDDTKAMTSLVSRVACFGRLRHKAVGFSGPLDRQLLSYAFMITAVRSSLRDLVESIIVSMFLGGDVDRDRDDWSDLAMSLPFTNDNGCGLGIAALTYLNAVNKEGDVPMDQVKAQIKAQEPPYNWFPYVSNLGKKLDNAFKIWDAIYAGTQVVGEDFKDGKIFKDTNEWLSSRR